MLFKYSVIRYVPNVVRDEALNLGVLLETSDPPGLYLRLLGRMSGIRRRYPEANVLAIRHFGEHFAKLQQAANPNQPVFDFARAAGITLDDLHTVSLDTNLQVTKPRATLGEDPVEELQDVFRLFVAEDAADDARERMALAPSRFRRVVASRLRQSGLLADDRLTAYFQAAGTVQPWVFDFGHRNTGLTLVQSIVLGAETNEAMNRALVLHARIEDVAEAEGAMPNTVAVTDELIGESAPTRYLQHHQIRIVPIDRASALRQILEPELHLQ